MVAERIYKRTPPRIPTLRHLRSIEGCIAGGVRIRWEPFGRKPWRIQFTNGDDMRGPIEAGWPFGRPYQFSTARDAADFLEGCRNRLGLVRERAAHTSTNAV